MAKHTIFLVHGMGDTASGWSAEIQDQLRALFDSYPTLAIVPFDSTFEFHEINYNGKFDALRMKWKDDAQSVFDAISAAAKGKPKKEQSEAGAATQELMKFASGSARTGFLRSHVLDVVLYRFLPQVREQVRASVRKQITGVLKHKPKNEPIRWSIVAHSLGTAVAHDTLHAMYTDKQAPFPSNVARPRVLAMIANVSRILETDSDPYTSFTRPSIHAKSGVCDFFLNARHEWDLFTVPKRFKPQDDWPDVATRADRRYRPIPINAFADKNVHALGHYLANPQVHIELFRTLTFDASISDGAKQNAITIFEAATPLGKFDAVLQKIKGISIAEESSWDEVIQAYKEFVELVG